MAERFDYSGKEDFLTRSGEEVFALLETSLSGLDEAEAQRRAGLFGPNELKEGKKRTLLIMFIDQFKNIMILVLMAAAIISGFLGELMDSFIILAVLLLNAILGVIQENKAEKALAALKKLAAPHAKVIRDGQVSLIKTSRLVPGDLVLLEAGDNVPADMRLVEVHNLKIEEAALTGESVPVEKATEKIENPDTPLGDRKNMAYLGSSVTYGRGVGVVTAIGMDTEVGKIAGYISQWGEEETPLVRKLAGISKYLSAAVGIIAVIIFAAGVVQGRPYFEMFLTSVSLAVAAIPEGLPAVVTIVLALGVQRMAKRNAIIRRLPAVETLGGTNIICSDKTGTLTQNKMTVKEVYAGGKLIPADEKEKAVPDEETLMQIMVLCNDSKVSSAGNGALKVMGDPTETALIYYAHSRGYKKDEMEKRMERRGEIPFESERKLMSTVNSTGKGLRILTKGAVDMLLDRCSHILEGGQAKEFTEERRAEVLEANGQMAKKALRVLALAYRDLDEMPLELESRECEKDLVFTGLVGMIDPPREEAKEAVRICEEAGIRPIMITGDHRDTAEAIARELGIMTREDQIITGSELDKIPDEEFEKRVSDYSVYARVSPVHKVKIVKAWKNKGMVVAMTGDGVNDAPALKAADIGIGMGITGTDVAKGVSDMILADDNFATIVAAVEEGRKVYSNIKKTVQFLLSANMCEVVTLFVATMFNGKILSPVHILWINLVTDTFPALAFSFERAEKDIMKQKPGKDKDSFFARGVGAGIIYQGLLQGALVLGTYYLARRLYPGQDLLASTIAFMTLGLIQLAHSFNVRSLKNSVFRLGFLTNPQLIAGVAVSVLLQVSVVGLPFLNRIFEVARLNLWQWLMVLAASLLIIPLVELAKFIHRKFF